MFTYLLNFILLQLKPVLNMNCFVQKFQNHIVRSRNHLVIGTGLISMMMMMMLIIVAQLQLLYSALARRLSLKKFSDSRLPVFYTWYSTVTCNLIT